MCGGVERTDFLQFLFWEDVVVFKELISNISILGGYGGLEITDF